MRNIAKEQSQWLTPDHLRSLTANDLLSFVVKSNDIKTLRHIAQIRFAGEARMENEDNNAPFIRWLAMNQELKPWLPLLLAKVADRELSLNEKQNLVVIAAPSSATPYIDHIKRYHLFFNAQYPLVLKEHQFEEFRVSKNDTPYIPVPSYVHGRDSLTGARGTQDVFFFQPEIYEDATIILFDDALAEGLTAETIGTFVKSRLHARQFLVGVSMAKAVQGGEDHLKTSGLVDGLSVLIHITKTYGKGKPIEFY